MLVQIHKIPEYIIIFQRIKLRENAFKSWVLCIISALLTPKLPLQQYQLCANVKISSETIHRKERLQ